MGQDGIIKESGGGYHLLTIAKKDWYCSNTVRWVVQEVVGYGVIISHIGVISSYQVKDGVWPILLRCWGHQELGWFLNHCLHTIQTIQQPEFTQKISMHYAERCHFMNILHCLKQWVKKYNDEKCSAFYKNILYNYKSPCLEYGMGQKKSPEKQTES